MKRPFLISTAILFFIGLKLQAQLSKDFEEKVHVWMTENNVPAVGVGIIEDGKVKYTRVFGELKEGMPASENTIFNVASITKPFIGMLVLRLVNSGDWELDQPLYNYWVDPDVINNPYHKKLTTRHILTHQSGFLNWRRQHPDNKLMFEFEPGTNYQYSGEGFIYLERALENKFNKTLVDLADSLLINPIGMKNTRLYWDKDMDETRFAYWHNGEGKLHKPATSRNYGVNAAGSLLTTVKDFCLFGIEVMNGFGISKELYSNMVTPHVMIGEHNSKGLGWNIILDIPEEEYAIVHGGADMGVQTMSVFLPKSKQGLVVFTNADNGMLVYDYIIREYLRAGNDVMNHYYNIKTHKIINLPDEVLMQYCGTFLDSYGRYLKIVKEEKWLEISGEGVPTIKLFPETENKFYPREFEVEFEFVETDSLIIKVEDGKIDCTAKKIM